MRAHHALHLTGRAFGQNASKTSSVNTDNGIIYADRDTTVYLACLKGTYTYTYNNFIEIPEGYVLKFKGGKIKNGTIVFKNTLLRNAKASVFKDVDISGTIKNKTKRLDWFSYTSDNKDCSNLVRSLVKGGGTLVFGKKEYLMDCYGKNSIKLESNTMLDGKDAILNANYSVNGIHALFEITDDNNITAKNLTIKGVESGIQTPPEGHGTTAYASSNIYAFFLNNVCSNIRFSNLNLEKVSYGIKSSKTSNSNLAKLTDCVIENCNFECDMPIQGSGWCNLTITNCEISSLGKNSGLHALYITAGTTGTNDSVIKDDKANLESVYIKDCVCKSKAGDGTTVQIYDAKKRNISRSTYFRHCTLIHESGNPIINSEGNKLYLSDCVLESEKSAMQGVMQDYVEYRNCNFKNIGMRGGVYHKCSFYRDNAVILGSSLGIKCYGCTIKSDSFVFYALPSGYFERCTIFTAHNDGFISNRNGEFNGTLTFNNCSITAPKLSYSPNQTGNQIIEFKNCNISSFNDQNHFFKRNDKSNIEVKTNNLLFKTVLAE